MEIKIDPSIPALSEKEKAEIKARSKSAESDPEEFKRQVLGCHTVVMSPEVLEQIKAMGLTPDEVVADLLKAAGAQQ